MSPSGALSRRWLRAPSESGQALVEPPREALAERIAENRAALLQQNVACGDTTLAELAHDARRELLERAWRYTSAYRPAGPPPDFDRRRPVILAGHQPQLFHAGVWFKNFLLDDLGRRHRAWCVNLLIDNDTCRSASVRVPTGPLSAPRLVSVPYDRFATGLPHEERPVGDRRTFESFADRVQETLRGLIDRPLVEPLWAHALEALSAADRRAAEHGTPPNLGRCLAQARHCLEADWGLKHWEVPLSEVCRGRSFRQFLRHLLVHAPRLREVYNRCLGEYRRANRIRSRSHPVPALASRDGWCETPFWIWTRQDPRRRGLFVRRLPSGLELGDSNGPRRILDAPATRGDAAAVESLERWEAEGIRIRPRALTTTMFARLLLSDLFVHGIGGAKYDELTDAIIADFFGVRPPHFAVATATLRLPLELPAGNAEDRLRRIDHELREMRFHPERFVPATPETRPLVAQKLAWLAADPPSGNRKPRHEGIVASNEALQPFLAERRERCLGARRQAEFDARRQRLLGSREFSFCLFPAGGLPTTLLELSRQEP